jgi:hypothetical protein
MTLIRYKYFLIFVNRNDRLSVKGSTDNKAALLKLNFQLRLRCASAAISSQNNRRPISNCDCDARARLRWPCDAAIEE